MAVRQGNFQWSRCWSTIIDGGTIHDKNLGGAQVRDGHFRGELYYPSRHVARYVPLVRVTRHVARPIRNFDGDVVVIVGGRCIE